MTEPALANQSPAERARLLATTLHAGQVDKAGRPYIEHLQRVVSNLMQRFPDATTAEIEAAWLHDAIEDTAATERTLYDAGVSVAAIEIIHALTRPQGEYLAWIRQIAWYGSISAVRVKLADNIDNRDPARVALLPADQTTRARLERYVTASQILENRIWQEFQNSDC